MQTLLDALDAFLHEAQGIRKERTLGRLIPGLERDVARGFQRQGAVFGQMLNRQRADWTPEAQQMAFDWGTAWTATAEKTAPALVDPIVRYIKLALVAGGDALYDALSMVGTFNLKHPDAVRYLEQHGAEMVSKIDEETRSQLNTLITNAADDGWSYDKLARGIRDKFDGFAGAMPQQHIQSRAHLVAVTELGQAYEEGNYMVGEELRDMGFVMEKSWLTVGDGRVCSDQCEVNQNAGENGWIPFEQAFPSGHMHPLAHPACRCTLLMQRRPSAAGIANPRDIGQEFSGWEQRLTPSQRDALKLYQSSGYHDINDALRNRSAIDQATRAEIDNIESAISQGVLADDTTVWRGSSADWLGDIESLDGAIIQDRGFMSTSVNAQSADKFAAYALEDTGSCAIWQIKVPKGTNAAYMETQLAGLGEKELLLPKEGTLVITRVERSVFSYTPWGEDYSNKPVVRIYAEWQ